MKADTASGCNQSAKSHEQSGMHGRTAMLTQLAKTLCKTRESRLDNNEHLVVTAQLQAFSSVANAPKYAVPMLSLKSAN